MADPERGARGTLLDDSRNEPDMTEPIRSESVILRSLETPTLTKAELADLLFERIGLNKRESKDLVEAFFELLHDALIHGREVKLSGFGNFSIRGKASRPGRNPRTGEAIPIKARTWSPSTRATS
jgi:integration host factor subunit alpha